jgi:asparagine synthase (glutamine-hydrolysing)
MCGIAGQLRVGSAAETRVEESLLRRMADTIRHRGPDGEGYFLEHGPGFSVGLAHRRLAIVDLATGAQPMEDARKQCVITFNGEIFNYQRVRAELEAEGREFRTHSDTEVIVAGYASRGSVRYGANTHQRLDGQFAYAVWDRRDHTLRLVRDPVGIKPLYWSWRPQPGGGVLSFASELKAIEALGEALTPDLRALDLYLTYGYVPAPLTIWSEVRKLMPGEMQVVASSAATSEPRSVAYSSSAAFLTLRQPEPFTSADELQAELGNAVRDQLMSDVPLGAFLSGGVDSTSVVAAMSDWSDAPKCFTVGFDNNDEDVSRSRVVADGFGARLNTREAVASHMQEKLPVLAAQFDEPFCSPSLIPTDIVCEFARTQVTVALSGDGGDELFGGYKRYWRFLNANAATGLRGLARRLTARMAAAVPGEGSTLRRARAALRSPGLEYAQYVMMSSAAQRRQIYTAETCAGLGGVFKRVRAGSLDGGGIIVPEDGIDDGHEIATLWSDVDNSVHELWRGDGPFPAPVKATELGAVDMQSFMVDHVLTKVDRLSMRHSLEVRVPFLSPSFIRRAFATPDHLKFEREGGRPDGKIIGGKKLLKDALKKRFPASFVDAPKRGFSAPLKQWLGAPEVLRVREAMLSPEGKRLFDPKATAKLLDRMAAGRGSRQFLHALYVLSIWIERNGARLK